MLLSLNLIAGRRLTKLVKDHPKQVGANYNRDYFNGKDSRTVDGCNRNKREVACDDGYQET